MRLAPVPVIGALLLALTVGSAACGISGVQAAPTTPETDDTTLSAGDLFDVRVYGEPDLTSNYRVEQDGMIDFPYVGRLQVADQEPTAIARLIETRLREDGVLVNPQVSVLVSEYVSKRINITGAVESPGNFSIAPGLTAFQAVGLAGGTTALANRDATIVTRRVNGVLRRYAVPLDQIRIGQAEDFRVRSGDIIYVPERPF